MPVDVALAAVDRLLSEGHDHLALTFFGGEPLLRRETIESLWPSLRERGARRGALVTAKICTNGALLDRSFAAFARRTALFVSLSTDGGPQAQDGGRRDAAGARTSPLVEQALSALRDERTPFATYSVITPQNARHLADSVAWLWARGSRTLITTLDFGADWTAPDLDVLATSYRAVARQYVRWTRSREAFFLAPFDSKIAARTHPGYWRGNSCRAGVRQVAVDPAGFIYPCIEFLESERYRIGDVWRGVDRAEWKRLNLDHGGHAPDVCEDCGVHDRCGSTCAYLNLRTAGSMRDVVGLLCAHERLVVQAADRLAAWLWRRKDRGFIDRQYNPWHEPLELLESLLPGARPS